MKKLIFLAIVFQINCLMCGDQSNEGLPFGPTLKGLHYYGLGPDYLRPKSFITPLVLPVGTTNTLTDLEKELNFSKKYIIQNALEYLTEYENEPAKYAFLQQEGALNLDLTQELVLNALGMVHDSLTSQEYHIAGLAYIKLYKNLKLIMQSEQSTPADQKAVYTQAIKENAAVLKELLKKTPL